MRVFALFFALYFTILGCLSCADEEVRTDSSSVATVIQPAHHHAPSLVADWCSPLCQCHCCPGFPIPTAPAVAFTAVPTLPEVVPCFQEQAAPAVPVRAHGAQWQPPQQA